MATGLMDTIQLAREAGKVFAEELGKDGELDLIQLIDGPDGMRWARDMLQARGMCADGLEAQAWAKAAIGRGRELAS